MSRRRRYLSCLLLLYCGVTLSLPLIVMQSCSRSRAQKQRFRFPSPRDPSTRFSQGKRPRIGGTRVRSWLDSNLELAQLAALGRHRSTDAESRNKLADAYFRAGLDWSAYHLFHEVETLSGGDFHAELGLARVWGQVQDYSMARTQVLDALAKNAKSAEAYELMGRSTPRQRFEDAIAPSRSFGPCSGDACIGSPNLGYAYMLNECCREAQARIEGRSPRIQACRRLVTIWVSF